MIMDPDLPMFTGTYIDILPESVVAGTRRSSHPGAADGAG